MNRITFFFSSLMPRCPSYRKGGFKDQHAVMMHMSQPTSGCNTWVNDLVSIQESLVPPKFRVQLATSGVTVTQCPIRFQWTLMRNSIQFWIPLPQPTITTGSPPPSRMVLNAMVSTRSDLRAQLDHSEAVPPSWTNSIEISSVTSGSQTFTILSLPTASGNLPCGCFVRASV